ncbi:MAG TPA: SIMPL domain-containing protein [Thermomicrobiales bacterium]
MEHVRQPGLRRSALVVLTLGIVGLVGAATFAFSPRATAQTPIATSTGPATVQVSGSGSVVVEPDAATIVLGVTVLEPTLTAAQESATSQMTAILEALREAGIADRDIQTASYNVNILQDYDDQGNPTTIRGFQIVNLVNVTVRDLDQLGSILDTVVDRGANTIHGINFIVTDPSTAATQARTLAVNDAMEKAQQLASAAGMTVGRVLSISESYSPPPTPLGLGEMARAADAAVPIQPGTQTISVDVQMTFELN